MSPFTIQFDKLKWVPNFDRSRWFLVLGIKKPENDELNRLLTACNAAAQDCGHPGLYVGGVGDGPMEQDEEEEEPETKSNAARPRKRLRRSSHQPSEPSNTAKGRNLEQSAIQDRTDRFHISIAWNLIPPEPTWIKLVQDMDVNAMIRSPELPFNAVKLRIGREVHNLFLLGNKMTAGRKSSGILGL